MGPHPRWDHWPLAAPQVNTLFTWKNKIKDYLTENMDSVITLFQYMGPALSPSILLKFLNLLCVSVSLSSPVFSFKNKFQQWLWQALKEEVLWVCSLGSVAGLLAAELQTALSLSTRAPLQQPPLTLVDLTVPPPSQLRVRTLIVTKNQTTRTERKITYRKYFHWTLILMSNACNCIYRKIASIEKKISFYVGVGWRGKILNIW